MVIVLLAFPQMTGATETETSAQTWSRTRADATGPALLEVQADGTTYVLSGAALVDGRQVIFLDAEASTVQGLQGMVDPSAVPVYHMQGADQSADNARFGAPAIVMRAHSAPNATALGLQSVEAAGAGLYIGGLASAWEAPEAARRAAADPGVQDAYPSLSRIAQPTQAIDDPLYGFQWHLENTGQTGGSAGIDVNVESAWDTVDGTGVLVSVVDDSVQNDHPDLAAGYVAQDSYDHCDDDADPSPVAAEDNHGTSVAGVALARANSDGGRGSAPEAGFIGQRLIACAIGDSHIAAALTAGLDAVDISTNSWGCSGFYCDLGPLADAGVQNGVDNGRDGKGIVYLFAAGNDREGLQDTNYDALNADRRVIGVGAIDHNGAFSSYSTPCSCLLVGAPSSGDAVGITTTDRTGTDGYNDGSGGDHADTDYTGTFGGTSSSTPLVAGVVALMLEANPSLTWRDVQAILVETAVRAPLGTTDWVTNDAGHVSSRDFGFGMVNAGAAVTAAQTWTNLPAEQMTSASYAGPPLSIPDGTADAFDSPGAPVSQSVTIGDDMVVESVRVDFQASHTCRSDIRLELTSPAGTTSRIIPGNFMCGEAEWQWQATSNQFFGESSLGDWTLNAFDIWQGDTGNIDSFTVNIFGHSVGGGGSSQAPRLRSLTCVPNPVQAGQAIDCKVKAEDVDSAGVGFEIDLGDGGTYSVPLDDYVAPGTLFLWQHTYATPGEYELDFTPVDAEGNQGEAVSTFITVEEAVNQAPVIDSWTCDDSAVVGQEFECWVTASDDGGVRYAMDWGDGATDVRPSESEFFRPDVPRWQRHTFGEDGTFTFTVTITDTHGATTTQTMEQVVQSVNPAPTITSWTCDDSAVVGQEFECWVTASDDGGVRYAMDWGDGATDVRPSESEFFRPDVPRWQRHTFGEDGTFTLTVTITDREGATVSESRQQTVTIPS